jgi:MtN3 and saliva related transmembrane protein
MDTTKIIINWIGAMLILISSIPQIYNIIKSKKTEGISVISYMIFNLACIILGFFAAIINAFPLWLTNGFSSLFACIIIYMIVKDNKKNALLAILLGLASVSLHIFFLFGHKNIFLNDTALSWNLVSKFDSISNTWKIIISLVGGLMLSVAFLPQAINTIKTNDAHNISLFVHLIYILGQTFIAIFFAIIVFYDKEYFNGITTFIFTVIAILISSLILKVKISNIIEIKKMKNDK